jgi:16S rRNA (guanine527-N7)-methyltransferase
MEWNELPGLFPNFPEPARWLPLLQRHAALLQENDSHTRVTAVAPADAIRRQYAESLEIWRIAAEEVGSRAGVAVDVGSGGGFPGLVAACIAPETRFSLVEPLRKRASLLEAVAQALGLSNVAVVAERAEEAGRGPLRGVADIVMARAVAPLRELLEYTAPFARTGGLLALAKGSGWEAELGEAHAAQEMLGCRFVGRTELRAEISETVCVLLLRQEREAVASYPRRAGLPRKRPL